MTGVALIAVGLALVLAGLFLRVRLPAAVVAVGIGLGACAVAAGGLLLVGAATPADWVVALALAVVGAVLHARLVLGPFGKPA